MDSIALGLLAALSASALFSIGLVLQAREARRVDASKSLHLSLIAQLIRRPRWLVGTAVTLAGYPLHVLAVVLAPLTVVQPALATGLLILLAAGARVGGERVRRRDVAGMAAIVVGVAAMTLAAPARADASVGGGILVGALVVLAAVTLVPYGVALARGENARSLALMATLAAGSAYAFSGLTTKFVADAIADGRPAAATGWIVATAVIGGLGFLGQVTALQHRSPTQVGPVIYVIPVLVPVLLAPLLTGEDWADTPFSGGLVLVALLVVCVGTAIVSGSTSVRRASERERAPAAGQSPLGLGR